MQPYHDPQADSDRPGTPPRPPYSPVTPVLAHLAPVPNGGAPAHPIVPPASSPSPTTRVASSFSAATPSDFPGPMSMAPPPPAAIVASEPPPVPISESENPDAIALRSALSILQLQKQQSLRDIRTLERLKKAAAADPEGFARELAAGNLSAKDPGGFVNFTHDEEDGGDGEDESGEAEESNKSRGASGLGTIPTPQNVVRMPPINWAKYQVVGEPLDRMHEEQRRRPSSGEPRREDSTQRAPEHLLAAPYRPLVDKLESPERVKRKQQK
ncbi:hypothetical protein ATEIFO6365_0009044700 [Aspergillus terreus]|uniref:Uncharacterized protein n=1 Tax=Aspergillus terreus TaxID=33178 RepID=A0A5M3ZCD2_ASPTE|nr:hypothetical protein ATETN484_0011044200 [Aspergillus terreus]GFF19084.1 hypothetical protein ATEIFO6365_0009044700 [Aspergillus terreus]